MLFDMRGETVPKAAAISMVNRTLKDDGHSPSARDCVEIVDALAAADGNDRVLNFTALEFWTVADRVMYPRTCECESASERADDTVPAEALAKDFPGVTVRDDDGDYWKSDGDEWRLYLSDVSRANGMPVEEREQLSRLFAPYVRVESLDSEGDEDRAGESEGADDTLEVGSLPDDYFGVVVQDCHGDFWKSDGFMWRLYSSRESLNRDDCDSLRPFLPAIYGPYVRVERLDSEGDEDRLSEDNDPVLFNLCRMIDVLQRVLGVNDVSARDLFGGFSAVELAKFALPEGAWDEYLATKAER